MRNFIEKYQSILLLVIIAFAFFTRMIRLNIPEGYMFDEVYHAVTAKLIARDDPRAYEWWNPSPEKDTAVDWLHPPVAKYFQALGILAFGENTFGWRISSVLFGIVVIVLTYRLMLELFADVPTALLSAALASLDGLLLVQSRIAMNDIHVTAFGLAALYAYVRFRKTQEFRLILLTSLLCGIALATKWSALFVLILILGWECLSLVQRLLTPQSDLRVRALATQLFQFFSTRILLLISIPAVIYIGGYTHMFLQGKDWAHFRELHNQIWWYQTHLTATHPYQSRPVEWFLNSKPVWMHVNFTTATERADVYAFGNPALFWLGGAAVIGGMITMVMRPKKFFIQSKKGSRRIPVVRMIQAVLSHPLTFLITAYWAVWLPWQFSPRIMFFYHYTPAVPLLSGILSYWLVRMYPKYPWVVSGVIASIVLCFAVWYPHWTALPVSTAFADRVYFALPQWR